VGGGESLDLSAALMLRSLQRAGPVLHVVALAGALDLELPDTPPLRRQCRLELGVARAHLGERCLVSPGLRLCGERCGTRRLECLGELGVLGQQPPELALLPRLAGAVLGADALQRARALAGSVELRAQRGSAFL